MTNKANAVNISGERKGVWMPSQTYKGYLVCSACNDCFIMPGWNTNGKWNYCPTCGAVMKKGDTENET